MLQSAEHINENNYTKARKQIKGVTNARLKYILSEKNGSINNKDSHKHDSGTESPFEKSRRQAKPGMVENDPEYFHFHSMLT